MPFADYSTMPDEAEFDAMPDAAPRAVPKSKSKPAPRAVPKSKSRPAPRAVPKSKSRPAPQPAPKASSGKPSLETESFRSATAPNAMRSAPSPAPTAGYPTTGYTEITIDDIIKMKGDTFQQVLFKIIDRKGMTDPEVYKKSNIDRKLFSKIRSNVDYMPSKNTVMALIIGLELNIDEATDLLQRAGYSFSPGSVADLTIQSCVMQHMYDIHTINCFLFDLGQKPLV